MKATATIKQRPAEPVQQSTWRSHAFGLHIEAPFPVPGTHVCDGAHLDPDTLITVASPEELDREWRGGDPEVIQDLHYPSGRRMITVEHRADLGFWIWMPHYGRYLISPDGGRMRCALPKVSPERWQRLLFAHPLPLAALLQGRAMVHASAVAVGEQAFIFTAGSGAGKTSVAGHLISRGARLVADDVVALERKGGRVIAHAGTGLINIDAREFASVPPELRARLGTPHGHLDKLILCSPVAERALPVRGVYFLEREPQVQRFAVQRIWPPDIRRLLSAHFFSYVRRPEVWQEHLEVCAALAASANLYEVTVPPGYTAARVAAEIEAHIDETA